MTTPLAYRKICDTTVIFSHGDPLGGIYGLVSGFVAVNIAPPGSMPRLVHMAQPSAWTGEGCFMTGQPRRVGLEAVAASWVMHLPLEAMERLAIRNPNIIRAFGMITILATDILVRMVHDLQKRSADRRIASVLHRMAWKDNLPIIVSQDSLGIMANASRKQTNAALQKFAAEGWILSGYRSIVVTDASALRQFAELPAGE
ncbi:Crp/Fnr family transcriptional regulator [Brucella pituitosa]|uniref:Crp/Fnr family transcriptional regulator n=1 Tax=Brucella pituitosa TaxID=571256 RepID=UPI0031F42FE6